MSKTKRCWCGLKTYLNRYGQEVCPNHGVIDEEETERDEEMKYVG